MANQLNKFFDTALGKSVQTLLWTILSYVLAIVLAKIASVKWSDQLLALGVPGLLNWILYTAKVFVDKEVPNLPNSLPMKVVPENAIIEIPAEVPPTVYSPGDQPAEDFLADDFSNDVLDNKWRGSDEAVADILIPNEKIEPLITDIKPPQRIS